MKTFLALMAFAMAFHIAARISAAHDAPSGWSYDPSCCNTMDCRPVDGPEGPRHHTVQIIETTGGYRISTTNEFISWKSKQVRQSKDGDFHWCSRNMGADNAPTICLYVPPRGY